MLYLCRRPLVVIPLPALLLVLGLPGVVDLESAVELRTARVQQFHVWRGTGIGHSLCINGTHGVEQE